MIFLATALSLCPPVGERVSCVIDADTFWTAGEKVRIADIDGAEINARCEAERVLAIRGRDRLLELLRDGFTVERVGVDKYHRTLGVVRDKRGRSVGAQLVSENLAREYHGGKRQGWC